MSFPSSLTNAWQLPFANHWEKHQVVEVYAELVRGGTQSYSELASYNETPVPYQPRVDTAPFTIPVCSLDPKDVVVMFNDYQDMVSISLVTDRVVQFPVHPANTSSSRVDAVLQKKTSEWTVFPTASTRTVRTLDSSNDAFKLHLPLQISRYQRGLGMEEIRHSIEVSRRLREYVDSASDPHTALVSENFGVAVVTEDGESKDGWGYLHRGLSLHPPLEDTIAIPLFSLFGTNPGSPDEPCLLVKILNQFDTNSERIRHVLDNVFFPIIRSWTSVFQATGIALQPHGQNARIELKICGDQYEPTGRIGHLDFDCPVFTSILNQIGASHQGLSKEQLISQEDQASKLSIIVDKWVGTMLFDQIADCLRKTYGIDPNVLHVECQDEFKRCFPYFGESFPEVTYTLSKTSIGHNQFERVSTGLPPTWRPAS